MRKIPFAVTLLCGSAIAVLGASAAQAQAQNSLPGDASTATSRAGPNEVEEVIVTAGKQSQNVQKVSAVVVAIPTESITERHVTDLVGLQNLAPSLKFGGTGTASNVFMRGVGTQNSATGSDPAVSVNVDGINMYRYALAGTLYDLARVEVVYGPQGTLYGRNSTAGVINFVTNTPGQEFGGYMNVDVGSFGLINAQGAVDMPINDDLAIRVAVNSLQHDGYTRTGREGDSGIGGESNISGRISALWRPNDRFRALAKVEYWHGGGSSQIAVDYPFINPDNPWFTPLTRDQWATWNDSHFILASAQIDYDFGNGFSLSYVPGFLHNEANYTLANGGVDAFITNAIPKTFVRRYYLPWTQYTNELRLSKTGERLRWIAGLYQYYGDSNSDPGLAYNAFPGVTGAPVARISGSGYDHTVEEAYGVFAQGTYSLTDELRIILGARYSYDPKSEDFNKGYVFTSGRFTASGLDETVPGGVHVIASETSKHFDYRAGLEWDVHPDVMLYANIATGFLDGGLITQPAVGLSPIFDPEYLTQYAVGVKSQFFDHRLLFNAELFYYDYTGLQITTNVLNRATGLGVSGVVNADKVRIDGADVTLRYQLGDDTSVYANVGYLPDAKITQLVTLAGDFAGYRMPYAAKLTTGLGIEHVFHLAGDAQVRARVDSSLSYGYWETFDHKPFTYQKGYTRTDASLAYQPASAKWSFAGWVKNIEDEGQITQASGNGNAIITAPRTYGVTLRVNF